MSMLVPLNVITSFEIPLRLDIYNESSVLSNATEQVFCVTTRLANLALREANMLAFSFHVGNTSLECEFQLVGHPLTAGECHDIHLGKPRLPVQAGNVPEFVTIFNFGSYAALLVPLGRGHEPFETVHALSRERLSPAEAKASQEEKTRRNHLVFIDLTPHRSPPPDRHRESSALPALLAGRAA